MDEIKQLKARINNLEGTLRDTEMILFDPRVAWALRHAMRVKKDTEKAFKEIYHNIQKLQAAKRRRPG